MINQENVFDQSRSHSKIWFPILLELYSEMKSQNMLYAPVKKSDFINFFMFNYYCTSLLNELNVYGAVDLMGFGTIFPKQNTSLKYFKIVINRLLRGQGPVDEKERDIYLARSMDNMIRARYYDHSKKVLSKISYVRSHRRLQGIRDAGGFSQYLSSGDVGLPSQLIRQRVSFYEETGIDLAFLEHQVRQGGGESGILALT